MRYGWVLFGLLCCPGIVAGQGQGTLRITAALSDPAAPSTPIARHALLISDNPATREPRRIMTAADGSATVTLPAGSYIVESDRPFTFGGRAYQWTKVLEIVAGREATLHLTLENAEPVPIPSTPAERGSVPAPDDPVVVAGKWLDSVVAVWSPTSRASGFLVDHRGVIATDGRAIGTADIVEVQLTPTMKVPARVLTSDPTRGVALLWIDPAVVADRSPLPLPCPPGPTPSLDDGQAITAIGEPHQAAKTVERGDVTALHPRRVDTDLRLAFGAVGGPVFDETGALVGLTSAAVDDSRRPGDVTVVRTVFVCDALAAALPTLAGAAPPEPTRLPVDPDRSAHVQQPEGAKGPTAAAIPPVLSSPSFDVTLLTPRIVQRSEPRTGGTRARSTEAEARLGPLTDFGAWTEYFASVPPVLTVRVTPKLVEGFWKRLGREAARTQGAVLPPFKDFKTSFRRLRATCDGNEVAPIHPFVLEHRVSEKTVVREGLYVFDADAFGPDCASVTLLLYSDAQPEKADAVTLSRAVVEQIRQDLAPYRATGQ